MFRRRREEEDPFAALKDAAERGAAHVAARPADSSRAAFGEEPRRTEPRPLHLDEDPSPLTVPPPARSRRGSDRLLVLLTILLALGGAGALVWQSEGDADVHAGAATPGPGDDGLTGSGKDGAGPGGKDGAPADLVRPAGFAAALRAVRGELRPRERVWMVRVARDRLTAYTALPDDRQRLVTVDADRSVRADDGGHVGAHTALTLSRLDPEAPSGAVRAAARRGRFSTAKLDYLLLMGPPAVFREPPTWSVYFTGVPRRDRHWTAALDGSSPHRPGESTGSGSTTTSSSSRLTITRNGRTVRLDGAQAQRITRCVQRAGTDAAAIQRCLP